MEEQELFSKIAGYYSGVDDKVAIKEELGKDSKAKSMFDWIDSFWCKLKYKTNHTESIKSRTNKIINEKLNVIPFWKRSIKYAAAVLILISGGISFYLFSKQNTRIMTVSSSIGEVKEVPLPDGSKVWLNAQSSLSYPVKFSGKSRDVSVKGEVYFEVVKNDLQPFIVDYGLAYLKVLGTSFTINNYIDEPAANIYLVEGSVELSLKQLNQLVVMTPGDEVSIDKKTLKFTKENNPNLTRDSWRFGKLSYYNEPLSKIVRELERKFGVEIIIDTPVKNMKLTADFDNLKLENILESICQGSRLSCVNEDNKYILKKK